MIKIPTLIVSGASEPVHRFPTGSSARAAFTSRNQGPSIAINLSHNNIVNIPNQQIPGSPDGGQNPDAVGALPAGAGAAQTHRREER